MIELSRVLFLLWKLLGMLWAHSLESKVFGNPPQCVGKLV